MFAVMNGRSSATRLVGGRTGRKGEHPLVRRGREITVVKEIEARETRTGRIGMRSEIGIGGEAGSEIEAARGSGSGSGSRSGRERGRE
jgi:hypothetical protein